MDTVKIILNHEIHEISRGDRPVALPSSHEKRSYSRQKSVGYKFYIFLSLFMDIYFGMYKAGASLTMRAFLMASSERSKIADKTSDGLIV